MLVNRMLKRFTRSDSSHELRDIKDMTVDLRSNTQDEQDGGGIPAELSDNRCMTSSLCETILCNLLVVAIKEDGCSLLLMRVLPSCRDDIIHSQS